MPKTPHWRPAAAATHPNEEDTFSRWLNGGDYARMAVFADMIEDQRGQNHYSPLLRKVAEDRNPAVEWFYRDECRPPYVTREARLRNACQSAWAEAEYHTHTGGGVLRRGKWRFVWERDYGRELLLWTCQLQEFVVGARTNWWETLEVEMGIDLGDRVPTDDVDGNAAIPEARSAYVRLAMPRLDHDTMPDWMQLPVVRVRESVVFRQYVMNFRSNGRTPNERGGVFALIPEMPSDIWLMDDGANVRDDCEAYTLDAERHIRQTSVHYKSFMRSSVPLDATGYVLSLDLKQQMFDVMYLDVTKVNQAPAGYMKTLRARRAVEREVYRSQQQGAQS